MAGGLMRAPQARVTKTPADMNRLAAERRGETPKRTSKREIAARLKAQAREEAVLDAQRPEVISRAYDIYLRTGGPHPWQS